MQARGLLSNLLAAVDIRLLVLTGIFCFLCVIYTLVRPRKQDVLSKFRLRSRDSHARTPPRSLTPQPEKKVPNNSAVSVEQLGTSFPPNGQEALESLAEKLPFEQRRKLMGYKVDESVWTQNLVPLTADYRSCEDNLYTPTGLSVGQIRALGSFPDYAELSGVPLPQPYAEFDISKAIPRPYRPFRWAYHQTMSLTKLEPDWWLELASTYKETIAQRKLLYAQHGESVLQWLPGSELACKELMEMCLQFLAARYPQYFRLSGDKKTFINLILGEEQDLRAKHPLLIILDNIPEDFAVMMRDPDSGYYFFRAGVICSALGWNLGSKIGLRLNEIHEPIPDYKEKMQFSMDRFFSKMPTIRPIQRGSWGLEVDTPLYMPPGDPHEMHRLSQSPDLTIERCHLRVDWQTLRRLPLSGAIVFNFKGLFTPVQEFRDEPYIPSLILKVVREGKKSIMEYKNTWHTEHVILPALEAYEKEQVENGMIPKDWEVHTLDDSPWYPGWKEKWHKQQGF
ncbi:MAG: hypothetical protein Q9227_003059 [Pyrenula ochraceoflavens]